MDFEVRIAEEFERRKDGLLAFAALLGFAFFINRGIELKGLYMDDLYLWSCYGEQSFLEYVFPIGSTRFRFLFYLASWLELFFIGSRVTWMAPFNIILNALIAFTIYRMALRFSGRKWIGLAVGAAYLLSRLSYYQIGQFYGLMESLGLWAAIGILYFLYRYVNERDTKAYLLANLLYFSASFIHERYMALLPVLFIALLLGGGRESAVRPPSGEPHARNRSRRRAQGERSTPVWMLFLATAAVFGAIQLIRFLTIGTLSPAGTGGTDVADTFSMAGAIDHAWRQVGFVFGIGSGPSYLCGLPYGDSPDAVKNWILAANVTLGILVVCFLTAWARDRGRWLFHLKNVILFLSFIAFSIAASSVTVRVEMRWVYVTYAAALLFLAYMSACAGWGRFLVLLYLALLFPTETFYRGTYDSLHLWPNQLRYNSLAEETVEKYGDEIFDKEIYVIGNSYEMSDFTAETFFEVYGKGKKGEDLNVRFIGSEFDIKEITNDMVILREDPEHNAYQDVTSFVRAQRFRRVYGSYEDGWMEDRARVVFMTGEKGSVTLSCYYPGEITGDQACQIKMNGRRLPDLVFTDNLMAYELPSFPDQEVSLEFSCNFYVKDAKEKRGDRNLAMITDIRIE